MASSVRSVNVDHVNRLAEAVRTGGELNMEKFLRVASDMGGYTPETDLRYKPNGQTDETDEIERLEWVSPVAGFEGSGSQSPIRSRPAPVHAFRYHAGAFVGRPRGNPRR